MWSRSVTNRFNSMCRYQNQHRSLASSSPSGSADFLELLDCISLPRHLEQLCQSGICPSPSFLHLITTCTDCIILKSIISCRPMFNRDFFIWRQDSSQMYFILFVFSIFQVQDGDGGEQTWEIEVYSASGLMCIWHQDREELLHLITRKTWVLFIGFWERGVWRLTFYIDERICVDRD